MKNKILITGCAGFIGFHLSNYLCTVGESICRNGFEIFGIDNLNNYYDVSLKERRLEILNKNINFTFYKIDIKNKNSVDKIFKSNDFSCVINLAAQAGVRYSFENPQAYIDSNVIGFMNIIESCKDTNIKFLIYASSSSVYGDCKNSPFKEEDQSIQSISLYGVTKKFNEEISFSYYKLFGINSIGLRFFTVYGPWGRPDMSLYKFVENILNDKEIEVYNYGKHNRSFTYVDDIIQSIYLIFNKFKNNDNFYVKRTSK